MTYDGANVKSYINGSLDSTHTLTGNIKSSTTDDVYIGNVNNTDDRHFKGNLDDVGIWNRALTASDIAEIAGPGDLTATASIITTGTDAGKLTVTPTSTSTLATIGPFTVEVDDGVMRNPADFTTALATTNKYDAPSDTVGSTPTVTFSGTDKGNLAATATVRADGQLDIKFTTGSPSGTGNFTMTVDGGAFHLDDPPPQGSGYVSGETPAFTITGADRGTTTTGNATVITTGPDAGKLNVDLSTVQPTGTGNLTLSIADGFKAPADLTGIGKDYVFGPPAETNPTVTVTGADRGTLITGTATVRSDGKLNITFPTNQFPTGSGDLTVTIANGVVQNPANIPIIGTGYDATETPTFTITDGDTTDTTPLPATTTGNATNNGDGTLSVDLSGIVPIGTGNLILTVNPGNVRAPANLTGIGNGYTPGDTPPTVTLTDLSGAPIPGFSATAAISGSGLDITFSGNPPDKNDVTIQIDDGVGRLANFSVPGSGYAPGEIPAVTVVGGSGSSGTASASVDASGTLIVDLSAVRTNDLNTRTVQIANGATLQTPADVTGIGDYHDPSGPPPTVILSGADGGLTATATVQPDGKVDVSFAGTPTTAGTLNVQVLGATGTGSTSVSSKYLLDIDGDLWDYSVAEFESFTELVSDARAQNGAEQNSLGTFWDLLSTNVNKLEQAAGRIKDADFAKEMTELSKSQIINRSAAVMHGKQNRITSEALLTLQNLNNML
jgi:flagellin-like hook-associated protein FlgL